MQLADSKLIGRKFAAKVESLSPFLSSLKIAVLRVEVNLFLLLQLLTALHTKAPSQSQNLRTKLTVNPSTVGTEVLFISSLSAFVISCKVLVPSMESLTSLESFLFKSSSKGSLSSSFTSCLLNIFS